MKTLKITTIMLALFTICACQKENANLLIIEAESMSGSKMLVRENHSYWATDDQVLINGQTYPISIGQNGQVSVDLTGHPIEAPFCGVYPASLNPSISGNNYTIGLPHSYTYSTLATTLLGEAVNLQNLQTPMLAYRQGDGNRLLFKHITAAITVEITNNFGFNIKVTNVTVSSNKYQLSGERTIDITNIENSVPACTTSTAADKQVQMTFTTVSGNASCLNIASGGTSRVQIPVLPVGSDNRFTISVTVQNTDGTKTYTFSKSQAEESTQTNFALLRAQIGYAPAKFGGVFSVSATEQVRFAPGNLQYQASTGTWRFAEHQYDCICHGAYGNVSENGTLCDNANISDNYSGWIDLFGWGTSGWDGRVNLSEEGNPPFYGRYYQPYSTDHSNGALYGPPGTNDLTGSYMESDWGYKNYISNGGGATHLWRTLTAAEWDYLLFSRLNNTGTHRSGNASVAGVIGIIILPDDFIDPMKRDGNQAFYPHYNAGGGSWYNNYTAENWVFMEAAGAIFLPVTDQRDGTTFGKSTTGVYWSSTHYESTEYSDKEAHTMYFNVDHHGMGHNPRYMGQAVRLVRNNNHETK